MQLRLDCVNMEETGRSDYRIDRTEGAILYPAYPPSLPEEDQRDKEKEVKIVAGNCPPIYHAQDNLNFFYNLERVHALNIRQTLD